VQLFGSVTKVGFGSVVGIRKRPVGFIGNRDTFGIWDAWTTTTTRRRTRRRSRTGKLDFVVFVCLRKHTMKSHETRAGSLMSCLVKVVVVNVSWVVSCLVLQVVLPWFTIVSAVSLGSSPQLVGIPRYYIAVSVNRGGFDHSDSDKFAKDSWQLSSDRKTRDY